MSRNLRAAGSSVVLLALLTGANGLAARADTSPAPAVATAAPGGAPGPVPAATVEGGPPAAPPRLRGIALSLGVRTDLVRSAGFDAFSKHDGLAQVSLSARYLRAPEGSLGVALGVSFDHGQSAAPARAASASLAINRLSLLLEGRWPVTARFTALVRVAPGWLWRSTSLDEGSLPNAPYTATSLGRAHQLTSAVTIDASAGLEYLVGRFGSRTALSGLGFSLLADGGYSYSPSRDVVLSYAAASADPGAARSDEPIRLGKLAVGGAFLRFALALSL